MHRLLEVELNGDKVVSYPMHDCLIVDKEAEEIAIAELRQCIMHYARKTFDTSFIFEAAISVEEAGQDDRILEGRYYN